MFSNVTQKLKRNGDLQLENGLVYKGELHNGAAEGAGSLHFPDGGVFTGKWKAGAIDESAKGVYTFANGRTLRGSWRYIDEEDSYTGLLLNGKCAGWGRARFKIGGSYCGEFMDGMPFGKGSYTACDGSVFTGNWKYAAEENGYEGMLMDGRRCGQGIENLPDGSVYVGEFRNGRPAGRKASL